MTFSLSYAFPMDFSEPARVGKLSTGGSTQKRGSDSVLGAQL